MQFSGPYKNDLPSYHSQQASSRNQNLILSYAMEGVYLWKLESEIIEYSDEGKSQLLGVIKKFIIDFFKITSGDVEELIDLTLDFTETLKKFFMNIKIIEVDLVDYIIDEFSRFHNEIIDLQRDKAIEIIKTVNQTFPFEQLIKRFLIKDLEIEYEKNVFLTKIVQMKSLVFPDFYDLFISTFKPFIKNFSPQIESSIKKYIEKSIDDFGHKFEKSLSITKLRLESYLVDIAKSIQPMQVTVSMREIIDSSILGPWIICFQKLFDKEHIDLKQVVYFSPTSYLITIAFHDSNSILTAFNDNFIISISDNMIKDSSTVVCEGSTRENLIFIHSMLRSAYVVMEREGKLEANHKIEMFNEEVQKITTAVYLRMSKEILFIDESGNFRFHSLTKDNTYENNKSHIVPCNYNRVSLSPCGNFVMLVSNKEIYIFNSKLEMVLQYEAISDLICLTRTTLIMVYKPDSEEQEIVRANVNSDYISGVDISTSVIDKVDFGLRATYSFGRDLIKGMIEKRRFEKFRPPA